MTLLRRIDSAIVCGSRDWPETWNWFITAEMIRHFEYRHTKVITGGARGVDDHAKREAARLGYPFHTIYPDWDLHGRRAGIVRNLAMLDLRPDLVLAFHYNGSPGTAHTIAEARKRGIEVIVHTKLPPPDLASLDTDHEVIGDML